MADTPAPTEADWLSAVRPDQLNDFLRGRETRRKRLLWCCACARQYRWHLLTLDVNRRAVEASERYADGLLSEREVRRAWEAMVWEPVIYSEWPSVSGFVGYRQASDAESAEMQERPFPHRRDGATRQRDWCDLLREMHANPFRPVTIDPAWLAWHDGTIENMARAIYDERAFGRMPVLADALEDAGCTDDAILDHCRGPNGHARGCWVIDGLLGKQ